MSGEESLSWKDTGLLTPSSFLRCKTCGASHRYPHPLVLVLWEKSARENHPATNRFVYLDGGQFRGFKTLYLRRVGASNIALTKSRLLRHDLPVHGVSTLARPWNSLERREMIGNPLTSYRSLLGSLGLKSKKIVWKRLPAPLAPESQVLGVFSPHLPCELTEANFRRFQWVFPQILVDFQSILID